MAHPYSTNTILMYYTHHLRGMYKQPFSINLLSLKKFGEKKSQKQVVKETQVGVSMGQFHQSHLYRNKTGPRVSFINDGSSVTKKRKYILQVGCQRLLFRGKKTVNWRNIMTSVTGRSVERDSLMITSYKKRFVP